MADPNITTLYNWLISDEVGLSTREADSMKVQYEKGDNALDAGWTETVSGITPSATTGTHLLAMDWAWYENHNPS